MLYQNITQSIGQVVSSKLATLNELQTVYSLKDLYDMLEILAIDSHNMERLRKQAQGK